MALGDGIRRNIAKASQVERDRFIEAIRQLDMTKIFPDGVSYWDKQDQIHQATHVHQGPAFLPWHRELCNRFEAMLREVDPELSLHYWDWTTDPRATPDGVGGTVNLFSNIFMGSASGRAGAPLDTFDNNGVLAGSRNQTGNPADPPQAISRDVAGGAVPPSPPTIVDSDAVLVIWGDGAPPEDQYPQFHVRIEGQFVRNHDAIHGYIGGTIGNPHSAFEDPFVFLIHSNVDRLWAMWQTQPGKVWRLDPDQVYGNEGGHIQITENLEPWAGGSGMRPWAPPENQQVVKNSKDPSVVCPPRYDTNFPAVPPVADANGPYTTDEGVDVILDGSLSSNPSGATLSFEWDLDNDGVFDDASGPNPVFNMVGQDGIFPIALKVTAGCVFDIDETTVTVNNVAPIVSLASDAPVNEGSSVTVRGTVTDPGWLETLTATIDWGDGTTVEPIIGVLENIRPDATLSFDVSHIYGDNGSFTAEVCGSDDDTTTCGTITLQVDNVNPTAEIDETGTVLVNGMPTFLAHAGEPVEFKGRSTDLGSDDLFLSWDWGDGPSSPDVTTSYLVNAPNPDLFPSPSVQPRDVTDTQTHAFAEACLYEITFSALDDDGGSASDTAVVLITGNTDGSRSSGYWQHQFGRQGHTDFDDATLQCYLAIVNNVSTVFSEARDASTVPAAHEVLFLKQNRGSQIKQLDRELMTAWLNFANGAFEYDQLFDPDHDGVFTSFTDLMAIAESVRLAPTSTITEIREQKNILQQLR